LAVCQDITIQLDATGNVSITEGDIDGGSTDNCAIDTIVASMTSFDCSNVGDNIVTLTVTDIYGNVNTCDATVTVEDNIDPNIITPASNIIVECDGQGNNGAIDAWLQNNGGATASDACGIVWSNDYSGAGSDCSQPVEVIFTATDPSGNSTSTTATYSIQDTNAPSIDTDALDTTVECDGEGNVQELADWLASNGGATASDDCSSVTWSNNAGSLSDECGMTGSVTVTFTATDGCGNFSETTATFTLVDTTPPSITAPADVTVECTEDTSSQATGTPTGIYDACSGISVGESDAVVDTCGNTMIITRTWTATDECGNATSVDQIITVVDTTPPSITAPADVTIECTEDASSQSQGIAIGSDTCGDITITESDSEVENCGNTKVITRTWTATDACGNTSSADQTITIVDTVAPVIITEASNETVEADGEGNLQIFQNWINTQGGAVATDNCSNVTWTHNFTDFNYICGKAGSVEVTFTAIDECGNATSTIANFTIVDSLGPVLSSIPPNITLECDTDLGTGVQGVAVFSDVNSDVEITYSDVFVSTRGAGGVLTRLWTATDQCGNITQVNQVITVEDTVPPTLTVPADVTVECTEDTSSASTGVATATDNCDAITVTENDSVVETCGNTMIITRTWTAEDNSGNMMSGDQIITVVDTTPPTLVVPADVTVECTEDYSSQGTGMATGDDSCGNVTISESDAMVDTCGNTMVITRTWTATDECGNATSANQVITVVDTTPPSIVVPEDMTVECTEDYTSQATGMATGSDTCGNVTITENDSVEDTCGNTMIITRTWTVTDECGNATSADQVITIVDTTPPTIVAPADVTIECTGDYSAQATGVATASDTCGSVTISESDATVDACGNTMIITRTWTATDECGNTASATQVITLEDTEGPTFDTMPADIVVTCAAEIPGDQGVTSSDSCDVAPSVVFTQSAAPACNGDVINTWTATDACGNQTVYSQTVTINDTIAPVFTSTEFPTDITVECDAVPSPLTMTAMDNCGGEIEVTLNEETIVPGTGCQNYTTTRVWSAMDCAGNEVTHTQVITVVDTTPPTIIEFPDSELTVTCADIPSPAEIFAVDNCSSAISTIFEEQILDPDSEGNYQIIRAWVLTDECGNESTFVQTINVESLDTVDSNNIIDLCIDDLSLDLLTLLSSDIDVSGTWSDDNNSGALSGNSFDPSNVQLGVYEFTYRSNDSDCAYSEVFRINVNDDCVVLPCSTDDIAISRVLTPNGDGHNEAFEISGLETCGYTYDVMIFNRWGAVVYQSTNYQNNWTGYNAEGGMTIGSSATLPTGTYYYVVKVLGGNGSNGVDSSAFKPITGYIYLGSN
ncbi:gliding motility-associated C-terminal domain-containing protein, partial [Urechidicola vernalis]